ncbi:hypothetical protein G6F46_003290 [Rhizopus delemar]|uniref:Alkyl hydroperoxide reductase subunit C/ Thiol specific antioxidant domain-containing protein n=2 Tax=Rhizopus TaxID=4842 RepID=A0A9P7CIC1_9FUNG|nr:hypothetical protein G6F43_009967 [Rhizopus delemar]KAG1533327.1 hypothetical protein G6F51_012672 [Rhizopus arrhizus]KAG1444252.1 hypothetical protein G6F55_012383 [Rhizopus delemar]KAG1494803.1 hypothetical protein G6F53_012505 [Rhizopus delemar]KAG1502735.1 hypothetical protein G6F54_002150 [Rhizopus delemar]
MTDNLSSINKRIRDLSLGHETDNALPMKQINLKRAIASISIPVFYRGSIFEMDIFNEIFSVPYIEYTIVFFCDYDFTEQSRRDLLQINENYAKFVQHCAAAVVITHDRPNVHYAYATPGFTYASLDFEPAFILASDSANRLLSTAFNSIDLQDYSIKRSMHVIDKHSNLIYSNHMKIKKQ